MKRTILSLSLILAITGNVGVAEEAELEECQNEQDKISGCVERWHYENGNLNFTIPYKNGKIEGTGKRYHENGNLMGETPFKNGKTEGIGKWYWENGDLRATLNYKNDKLISGKCSNGKTLTEAHLHNINKDKDIEELFTICSN